MPHGSTINIADMAVGPLLMTWQILTGQLTWQSVTWQGDVAYELAIDVNQSYVDMCHFQANGKLPHGSSHLAGCIKSLSWQGVWHNW